MYLYNRTFFKSDLRKTDEAVKLKVYVYKNLLINFSRFLHTFQIILVIFRSKLNIKYFLNFYRNNISII